MTEVCGEDGRRGARRGRGCCKTLGVVLALGLGFDEGSRAGEARGPLPPKFAWVGICKGQETRRFLIGLEGHVSGNLFPERLGGLLDDERIGAWVSLSLESEDVGPCYPRRGGQSKGSHGGFDTGFERFA
jgi:hypothetical protein